MNASIREQFRLKLLSILGAAGELGMREVAIEVHLLGAGLDFKDGEMQAEIRYLADKGLVVPVEKAISPENRRWRVSAAGRDLLAEQGLA